MLQLEACNNDGTKSTLFWAKTDIFWDCPKPTLFWYFFGFFNFFAIFKTGKNRRFWMSVLETVLKIHFWKSRWLFGFNQKPTDIESEILNLKSSKSVDFRLNRKSIKNEIWMIHQPRWLISNTNSYIELTHALKF